jgi:hopene-associated glycosyltransferase HpnB
MIFVLSMVALVAWAVLLVGRGGFWLADQMIDAPARPSAGASGAAPSVVAVVPARNEAEGIGRTVSSILSQHYEGSLRLVVVDDHSDDGTADLARQAAAAIGAADRLEVVAAQALPPGWSGKMWAVSQGVARASGFAPDFLWLTDGDIEHAPDTLARLTAKAERDGLALTSLMVLLHNRTVAERLLIPAFVFFFMKLYPFPWVNKPLHPMAAAAGGCMLVRRAALERAGGIECIKDAIIDDCALARLLKPQGPIWLGLTRKSHSLRVYECVCEIWAMVARTAYTQLEYSPLLLLGTVAGMVLLYLMPLVALFLGLRGNDPLLTASGGLTWLMMGIAFAPTLRLYRMAPWHGLTLPLAGVLYVLMTVDSARRHWLGRGGGWKGRTYAQGTGVQGG